MRARSIVERARAVEFRHYQGVSLSGGEHLKGGAQFGAAGHAAARLASVGVGGGVVPTSAGQFGGDAVGLVLEA